MKYTLPKSYANAGLCVEIPDAVLREYRSSLGSTKAAVNQWLYENGHMAKTEYEAMTEKEAASRKPVKKEFKIDNEKAEIINFIYERFLEYEDAEGNQKFDSIEVINPNRTISFSLGKDRYEVTLVRKKQPK
jgi:hypothetical protein